MRPSRTLWAIGALALVLAAPVQAYAQRVWREGTSARPLSVDSLDDAAFSTIRGDAGVAIERTVVWEYRRPGAEPFEPFSAVLLSNGRFLIASRSNEVLEVTRGKRIAWSYTRLADDPDLVNVYSAERLANGNTLITDRRADVVIEVTPAKKVVWKYGATPDSLAPGSLLDPFYATRLANGNTLVVDSRGGNRVLEVRSSDYDPDAPDLGYSASSIVWQYGQAGVAGVGSNQLASPRNAQRLANGNTLITDSGNQESIGNRVIEVTPAGTIAWQFGVTGSTGRDGSLLDRPSAAQRLANGNTLIVEEDGQRMLEVDHEGKVVDWYGPGEPYADGGVTGKMRSVQRTPSGTTVIGDQENQRVIELGYGQTGTVTSKRLSLGLPGVRKSVYRIEAIAEMPEGTSVAVEYSLDGGPWKGGGRSVKLPRGSTARELRYRLVLRTQSAGYTPTVREVRIDYDVAPASSTQGSGEGRGTSAGSGGSRGAGTSGSGGAGSRTGTGSGVGTGAGAGAGSVPAIGSAETTGDVALEAGAAPADGTRFTTGTLLQAVSSEGDRGRDRLAQSGAGGLQTGALVFLGVCYFLGLAGASVSGGQPAALQVLMSRIGWR